MKNFKRARWVSLLLVILLLFAPILHAAGEELPSPQTGILDGELLDEEDIDILEAYGDLLTAEQLEALEAAFVQMKDSITAAEKLYQDAIKTLKDKYRDAVQAAVKAIEDEAQMAAVLERLQSDILTAFAEVQKTFDEDASAARAALLALTEKLVIPVEIADAVVNWHVNKEQNTANELLKFVESFRNLSGNGNQGLGGNGLASGQLQMNQNSEKNRETIQNAGEQQNQEQLTQTEKNTQGNSNQSKQQGQSQDSGNGNGGKGKGKK